MNRKIYVSGPLTEGDRLLNVRNAILAANILLEAGDFPFCPHLTIMWDLIIPQSYDTWMRWDLTWLESCDALLRLPGPSKGADIEVAKAKDLKLPVYYNIEDLLPKHKRMTPVKLKP
jgi:hypothetical protein